MTIVALSQNFPSILHQPVLRAVDTDIFRLSYYARCMACSFCGDQCCSYGVDIDLDNARRLMDMGPEFEQFVGISAERWFTKEEIPDAEFPSGSHVRTQTMDGGCVFLDRKARGCKIHAWCVDRKIDYHALKPMVSVLFPATFDKGVLGPSGEARDKSLVCAGSGASIYDGIRHELAYYFGNRLVDELDTARSHALCA